MKYTIELTNKQKKQMDLMCELFHRYVGFNPKLEMDIPMKESPAYKKGFEDGKKQAINELPELANEENKIYDNGYNNALEDVSHAIDVLQDMTVEECAEYFEGRVGIDYVFEIFTIQRIISKTKAYEEKKKAEDESIKVGDEVISLSSNNKAVVTMVDDDNVMIVFTDGSCNEFNKGNYRKTGRHFDEIEQLLNKLGDEDND